MIELDLLERLAVLPNLTPSRKAELRELATQLTKENNPSTSMFDDCRECINVKFAQFRESARCELESSSNLVTVSKAFGSSKGSIYEDDDHGRPSLRPPPACFSISYPTEENYASVPKYMSRPLPLPDLYVMLNALEAAIEEQKKLTTIKFNTLPKHKKDIVIQLRDVARDLKIPLSAPFISETTWKAALETRLQAKMKWASQILRQLKLVKELRLKAKVYYLVTP